MLDAVRVEPARPRRVVGDQDLAGAAMAARCAARFIGSPSAVKSAALSVPTTPTNVRPVWTPTPNGTQAPSDES
jgi:hypothetical protein